MLQVPSTSRVSVCDAAGKPANNGPASLFASKTEQGSADLCECVDPSSWHNAGCSALLTIKLLWGVLAG